MQDCLYINVKALPLWKARLCCPPDAFKEADFQVLGRTIETGKKPIITFTFTPVETLVSQQLASDWTQVTTCLHFTLVE